MAIFHGKCNIFANVTATNGSKHKKKIHLQAKLTISRHQQTNQQKNRTKMRIQSKLK